MGCPKVDTVKCVSCNYRWQPASRDVRDHGKCPSCGGKSASAERCYDCPVNEVEHRRRHTRAGRLLERVLEHEFDAKHYKVSPGEVDVEVREGLKILEQERAKWDQETRERAEEEREEKRRVWEAQQRAQARM